MNACASQYRSIRLLDGGGVRVPADDETDKMITRSHLHRRRYRDMHRAGGSRAASASRRPHVGTDAAALLSTRRVATENIVGLGMSIDGMVVSGKEVFL
jgi:hypothetical protein